MFLHFLQKGGGNMEIKQLDKWVNDIQVNSTDHADVEVVNHSPLIMIGKGRQGAVLQVNDDICMKVFSNSEDCDREYYALSLGQKTNLFPRIYRKGSDFIAMELVKGVDLREYLQFQPLTPELFAKLINMLIMFKEIGFQRIDLHKRQIFLQLDGNIKVMDVAGMVWRDREYPYPRKLLTSLGEENKALFLTHVLEMAPHVYEEWLYYIQMEELSRQITEVLLSQEPDKETLKNLSNSLLTTDDEKNYVVLLQGLVHKIYKEEWIKLMLARGDDPEKVMEKIDEYWDKREQLVNQAQENHLDEDKYHHDDHKKRHNIRHSEDERQHDSEKHRYRERRFVGEEWREIGERRFVGENWREIR